MSELVKRYTVWDAYITLPHGTKLVGACAYDALAQRCRELEHRLEVKEEFYQDALHSHIVLVAQRDTLRAEVERLRGALGRISKLAGESECSSTPCSRQQLQFTAIMQQADAAMAAKEEV